MARPKKDGVDYFPLDVDIFSDSKIKMLRARYGADGVTLYLYLLCEIYRDKGYYLEWGEDTDYLLSCELGMSMDKIRQIKAFLLGRSLFDITLFRSVNVLSSRGIQRRYQLAVKARGSKTPVAVREDLWLLGEEETESFVQVRPKCENRSFCPGFSEKNTTKQSKANQSKSEESKTNKKQRKSNESTAEQSRSDFPAYARQSAPPQPARESHSAGCAAVPENDNAFVFASAKEPDRNAAVTVCERDADSEGRAAFADTAKAKASRNTANPQDSSPNPAELRNTQAAFPESAAPRNIQATFPESAAPGGTQTASLESAAPRGAQVSQACESERQSTVSRPLPEAAQAYSGDRICSAHREFERIKMPGSGEITRITELVGQFGEERVVQAIRDASRKGGRSLAYVERILEGSRRPVFAQETPQAPELPRQRSSLVYAPSYSISEMERMHYDEWISECLDYEKYPAE